MTTEDLLALLRQVKYDLSVTQTRVDDAIRAVAALPQTTNEDSRCPLCRIQFRSPRQVAEHVYNSHSGPVPDHYLAAERRAGLEP